MLSLLSLSVIPDWLDAESLQWMIIGTIMSLGTMTVMAMRFVRKLLLRLVLLAVFGGLSLGIWQQRANLQDCVDTCSCRLFGQEVEIPADKNPKCRLAPIGL